MKNENNLEDSKKSLFGLSRRGYRPATLQCSSQIVETGAICLEFSPIFLHSLFTPLYTLVLTPMCPSPSPLLSREYFHWNDCKPKPTWLGSGERKITQVFQDLWRVLKFNCRGLFFIFLGPKETRNSLHFSPLVSKKTSDIQAGGWDDSLQRRFYSIEGRWRFASFACT